MFIARDKGYQQETPEGCNDRAPWSHGKSREIYLATSTTLRPAGANGVIGRPCYKHCALRGGAH